MAACAKVAMSPTTDAGKGHGADGMEAVGLQPDEVLMRV